MFNQLGAFADMIKNAGKIREVAEKAYEAMGKTVVEAESGGGAVKVQANGRIEIVSVRIDESLLVDRDRELLEDLIVSAVNAALSRAHEVAAQSLTSLAGLTPAAHSPGFGPSTGLDRRGST